MVIKNVTNIFFHLESYLSVFSDGTSFQLVVYFHAIEMEEFKRINKEKSYEYGTIKKKIVKKLLSDTYYNCWYVRWAHKDSINILDYLLRCK